MPAAPFATILLPLAAIYLFQTFSTAFLSIISWLMRAVKYDKRAFSFLLSTFCSNSTNLPFWRILPTTTLCRKLNTSLFSVFAKFSIIAFCPWLPQPNHPLKAECEYLFQIIIFRSILFLHLWNCATSPCPCTGQSTLDKSKNLV